MESFKFEQHPEDTSEENKPTEENMHIEEIGEDELAFQNTLTEGLHGYGEEDSDRIREQIDLMFTKRQQEDIPLKELEGFFKQNRTAVEGGEKDIPTLIKELADMYAPE